MLLERLYASVWSETGWATWATRSSAMPEANGFSPIREFTGHGIGREMHEDPAVYNYGEPGRGLRLRRGMTLAVEPMICAGDWHLSVDEDGWCARTLDHSLTAHYEHTIAITEEGLPEILTLPGFSWEA